MKTPIVFGIAGGTASGKTTVAHKILDAVGADRVAYLPHDMYYRDNPHMTKEQRSQVNYDHPHSLETELLIAHVKQLRDGIGIELPNYDFVEHARTQSTTRIEPCPIVFVEGILIFTDPELRDLMDIKVYVDTDADVRVLRRLRRDVEERGRSMESVMMQYLSTVRPMHLEFVEPSKRYADVIIPEGGRNQVGIDMIVSRLVNLLSELASES